MIRIANLAELFNRLGRLDMSATQHHALGQAAAQLEEAVRDSLSHPPGSAHDTPWIRTGTLRASIQHSAGESSAVIGSSSAVALDQEQGTKTVPPRPFLAPAAALRGEQIANDIAEAIVTSIRQAVQGDVP